MSLKDVDKITEKNAKKVFNLRWVFHSSKSSKTSFAV
jgi:hypothetical protein